MGQLRLLLSLELCDAEVPECCMAQFSDDSSILNRKQIPSHVKTILQAIYYSLIYIMRLRLREVL